MAVQDRTVRELTELCGKRFAASGNSKSWIEIVSDAIRGRGITFGPDVRELKQRIAQTGATHSASSRKSRALTRKSREAVARKLAS